MSNDASTVRYVGPVDKVDTPYGTVARGDTLEGVPADAAKRLCESPDFEPATPAAPVKPTPTTTKQAPTAGQED